MQSLTPPQPQTEASCPDRNGATKAGRNPARCCTAPYAPENIMAQKFCIAGAAMVRLLLQRHEAARGLLQAQRLCLPAHGHV